MEKIMGGYTLGYQHCLSGWLEDLRIGGERAK